MKKNHYTYLIVNIYSYFQQKYLGTRSTDLEPLDDLGVKYFTSSSIKEFIQEQKEHPERFEYYILGVFDTREEAVQLEVYLHALYNVKSNPDYYNKANQTSTGFDTAGTTYKQSDESKKKRSVDMLGEKNPMFGKKGENHSKYGISPSKEHCEAVSKAHKGKKKKQVTCPYCGKIGGINNMSRWHFDNCKNNI